MLRKKEVVLGILATALMDALALAGIILMVPHAHEDPIGTVAVILIFAIWGAAYMGVVIGDDLKTRKQG